MKRAIVFLVAALALPTSVAFAKPSHPAKGGKSAPKVSYVLKGWLSSYTPGSQISITVKHANYHAKALNTKTLTFTLTANSKITFMRGSHAHGQILDGTKGYIVARAPKKLTGDPVTALPAATTRIHVVVLKAPIS